LRDVHARRVSLDEFVKIHYILILLAVVGVVHHNIAVAPPLKEAFGIMIVRLSSCKQGYFALVNGGQTAI
jgi:hypothetical protein